MKPPPFNYYAPSSLEDALTLRNEHAAGSVFLAGGQSLIPLLNLRMAAPSVVIDLGRIPALVGIRQAGGDVIIGAMTAQRVAERSRVIASKVPLMQQALGFIGHPAIRNRGTVGGSVVHADPAAELPAVIVALDGVLVARSPAGDRTVPAKEFFRGFLATALEPEEVLIEVKIPTEPRFTGTAFRELARRHGDFAVAGVGVALATDDESKITDARIVFSGVAATPVRALEAEALLRGERVGDALIAEAADLATQRLVPRSDALGTSEYRRRVAATLCRAALREAGQNG